MRRPLTVVSVPGHGAEDVLVVDGLVYTGTEDGSVFRLRTLARRPGRGASAPLTRRAAPAGDPHRGRAPAEGEAHRAGAGDDDAGRLVHDLEGDGSAYHMVTGVREHDGQVWLGSLVEPAVASMPIAGA
jgi:hypothetical protein